MKRIHGLFLPLVFPSGVAPGYRKQLRSSDERTPSIH